MHIKKRALVCLPSDRINEGLSREDLGQVDIDLAKRQHAAYCCSLQKFLGYQVVKLPANAAYPDSVFPEDWAIILENALVIARLRDPQRQGEEAFVEATLGTHFDQDQTFVIEPPGFLEGGDVVVSFKELFIGVSGRTNGDGAEQLAKIARDQYGYQSTIFSIPKDWLHLTGGLSFQVRKQCFIVNEEIGGVIFANARSDWIVTPADERFGANCISSLYKDHLLMHAGRPKTKAILEKKGFIVQEINLSEFDKIDGAMTCLRKMF